MNKGLEVGKYIVFVDSWLDLICRILVGVEKQLTGTSTQPRMSPLSSDL